MRYQRANSVVPSLVLCRRTVISYLSDMYRAITHITSFVSPNSFVSGQSTNLIFQACRHARDIFTSHDSYVGHRKGIMRQAQGFLFKGWKRLRTCLIASTRSIAGLNLVHPLLLPLRILARYSSFSNSDSFEASMNIQFARNLVPVSKKFPSTAILIGTCDFSTGRRAIARSPIVRKLENQRKLGQGLDEGLRLPCRTPAETPHSQQNEGLGAGEWLVKNARAFGFLSVSPQEAPEYCGSVQELR